jgi:hypothetical protein
MDLDVLLPFHRIDKYFEQAIDSLSATRGISFNTILIDDRLDKSQEVYSLVKSLKSFDIVRTDGGTGYSNALQQGTTYINEDCVALFNSDDLIDPSRFQRQIKELDIAELCISKMSRIKANNLNSTSISGAIESKHYDPIYLLLGAYGADASWCMRTEWWHQNAFFDDQDFLDWRIALTSFRKTTISYIPEVLYFYRKHNDQFTKNRINNNKDIENTYILWNMLAKSYGLPDFSFGLFSVFATPWRNNSSSNISEIKYFLDHVEQLQLINNSNIAPSFKKLIKRRLMLLARSNVNFFDKYWLFKQGRSELYPLILDVLKS